MHSYAWASKLFSEFVKKKASAVAKTWSRSKGGEGNWDTLKKNHRHVCSLGTFIWSSIVWVRKSILYIISIQNFVTSTTIYVTGFAKRGLPHTSNSPNLEDCSLGFTFKAYTNLKFSICINLCWYSLLSKFQGNGCFQSEIMNFQSR